MEKKPSSKKKHHYVPEMHLKRFVGDAPKGHVWTYSIDGSEARHSSPKETGAEMYFYGVEQDDGTMTTEYEDFLCGIESAAEPAYQELLAGKPLSREMRSRFSDYLAASYVRSPSMRRMWAYSAAGHMARNAKEMTSNEVAFQQRLRVMETQQGRTFSCDEVDTLRKHLRTGNFETVTIHRQDTLDVLHLVEDLAKILFSMKWSLVSPESGYFVTCDTPFFHEIARENIDGNGAGFSDIDSIVTFPLSPTVLLWMSYHPHLEGAAGTLCPEGVAEQNSLRAQQANKFIYAHAEDVEIKSLAMKHSEPRKGGFRFQASYLDQSIDVKIVRRKNP